MAKTFGRTLRDLRRATGISQRGLAQKVCVDFSYISKLENDRLPPPSADTILRICEVLSVAPEELLALTGKMPSPVKDMLSTSPAAQHFVRQAHAMGLSEEEWADLTKRLKKLRNR